MTRTIAFHSLRGGTGVTTLVANLGWQAALAGHRVTVVDGDLFQPSLHFALGLGTAPEGASLADVILSEAPAQRALRPIGEGAETFGGGSLHLAASTTTVEGMLRFAADGVPAGRLVDAINTFRTADDEALVLIDVPSGLRPESLFLLGCADEVVSVLRPEAQDFAAISAARAVVERLRVPEHRLLANRCVPGTDATLLGAKLKQAYGIEALGALPDAPELRTLGGRALFARAHAGHGFTRQLGRLARSLAEGRAAAGGRAQPLAPRTLSAVEAEAVG